MKDKEVQDFLRRRAAAAPIRAAQVEVDIKAELMARAAQVARAQSCAPGDVINMALEMFFAIGAMLNNSMVAAQILGGHVSSQPTREQPTREQPTREQPTREDELPTPEELLRRRRELVTGSVPAVPAGDRRIQDVGPAQGTSERRQS